LKRPKDEERANTYKLLSALYLREPEDRGMALEFTRLFIGPGKYIPPYESVHREGVLFGKVSSEVKRIIETSGLKYRSEFTGLPDHIGVEFEFMARLLQAKGNASGDERKRIEKLEKKFIQEHLTTWVPLFCDKVIEDAKLDFFKEVANRTKEFILKEGG
jgi:TorA maturation chaperone TorD